MEDNLIQVNDETSDSGITYESTEIEPLEDRALIHLDEDNDEHINLKHHFLICIGSLAECCFVVAIRRLVHCSSAMGMAQLEAFKRYVEAVGEKNGGNPNLNFGWYGTSIEGVGKIVKIGFGSDGIPMEGSFGLGICIYGGSFAAECILSSVDDANGLRHIIFCRVILGKTEHALPDTKPFGSDVNNQQISHNYFVWHPDAKTRVLPMYVLTVQLDIQSKVIKKEIVWPKLPWISFGKLIDTLSESLSSSKIRMIKKYHIKYMERKISQMQLITHLRQTVGAELLILVIRNFHERA